MPNSDTIIPSPNESAPVDHSVFDINRFNRTPEARWHAGRQASGSSHTGSRGNSEDDALSNVYQQFEPQQSTAESMGLDAEEMQQVIQRIMQTDQLLEWMRREKMGGLN